MVNDLTGWKREATIKRNNAKVCFEPVNYYTSLAAENIVYLMKLNRLIDSQVYNKYCEKIGITYTCSELFLHNGN